MQDRTTVIRAGRLIDGTTASGVQRGKAIFVDSGTITRVAPADGLPSDVEVIDLSSSTVLPGLIDCHVHLVWNGSADPNALLQRESNEKTAVRALLHPFEELMHGVTTVRDVGGLSHVTLAVRDARSPSPS